MDSVEVLVVMVIGTKKVIVVVEIILVELEAHKIVTNEEVGQWKFKN